MKEDFLKFLEENNCKWQYYSEVGKSLEPAKFSSVEEVIDYMVERGQTDQFICGTMSWVNTDSGFKYWQNINELWNKRIVELWIKRT